MLVYPAPSRYGVPDFKVRIGERAGEQVRDGQLGMTGRAEVDYQPVESHVSSVFAKLGIAESPESSRRVLAVLAYLQAEGRRRPRRA